jgi:septal ring factor EnvC (AmiA/AmiB activator)
MSKDDGKDFRFDEPDDEAYADALYREEMKDLRVEKLNQRVTIITILIPCLIGVILFIAYRDLTGKVTESEFSGSKEVRALSVELEEKLTQLNTQNSEFQAKLTEKIAAIEKSTGDLNAQLKTLGATLTKVKQNLDKTGADLKSIDAAKVDKTEQKASFEKINNTLIPMRKQLEVLAPIRKDLDSVVSEIEALDKRTREDLASVSTSVTKTNQELTQLQSIQDQFQTNLNVLGDEKIDQASLELELLKARKSYERTLDQEVVKIQRRLDALLKKTKRLETHLKQLEAAATTIPNSKTPAQSKSPQATKIEEQDLKE